MRSPSGGKSEFESRTGAVATRAYYRERCLAPCDRDAEDDRGRAGTNSQKYSLLSLYYSTSTRALTDFYYY